MGSRELDVVTSCTAGQARVVLSGWMDFDTATKFRMALIKLSQEEWSNVVIDCARLEYIDSSGIGQLLFWRSKLQEQNRTVTLANCTGGVLQVFKIASLHKLFTMQ